MMTKLNSILNLLNGHIGRCHDNKKTYFKEIKMKYSEARQERRKLKQALYKIRLKEEGKDIELTNEHLKLKKQYEALEGFTSWKDFPDKWDIGDPYSVKKRGYIFDDIDKKNYEKIAGKPYLSINKLDGKEEDNKIILEKENLKLTLTYNNN